MVCFGFFFLSRRVRHKRWALVTGVRRVLFRSEGLPYIVMEYVDGDSLGDWLLQDKPSLDQRLDLLETVCDAVAFAHRNLIIHRDITPSNILMTRAGVAKLIDFGIARPVSALRQDRSDASPPFATLRLTPVLAAHA